MFMVFSLYMTYKIICKGACSMFSRDEYHQKVEFMSAQFEEFNGYDFYNYIFPDNERAGELNNDFSKPNAVYLFKNEDDSIDRKMIRRIMLKDTWEDDYIKNVEMNEKALCSGLAYVGWANKI